MFKHSSIYLLILLLSIATVHCSVQVTYQTIDNGLLVHTIHGDMFIDEPILCELIVCPAMQRLKSIRQYGTCYYVFAKREEYTRFDHSLGVLYLLRTHGAPLTEQIAGLLHDVSHTVFSHACDPLFMGGFVQGAYQDTIHDTFLERFGISEILRRHNVNTADVMPKQIHFRALEQDLPSLCADRIEYNIVGGYIDYRIELDDIKKIHAALHFDGTNWYFDDQATARMLADISAWKTLNCWGSPTNILIGIYTSKALARALELKLIALDDILYQMSDDSMWHTLCSSNDYLIQSYVHNIIQVETNHIITDHLLDKTMIILRSKCRAINPLIKNGDTLHTLTELDAEYAQQYEQTAATMKQGWYATVIN